MAQFLFVLSRGPEDTTRATRTFFLANLALDKGHTATVFLLDEGVYWTNPTLAERTRIPTGDALAPIIQGIVAKGGKILVCKPCAEARQIDAADLPPGFSIDTAARLLELSLEAKVFSF